MGVWKLPVRALKREWTHSKGCDGTAQGTECSVCAGHTHSRDLLGIRAKLCPWVALCLEGRWQQLLCSGALRHPELGLAPALMDALFQGLVSGSLKWLRDLAFADSNTPSLPSCTCSAAGPGVVCLFLHAGASMERSLAAPVCEPGCLLYLQVQTLCVVSVLSAFGSQGAAGPDAWESSPAYPSLCFSPGVELAQKHWDLEVIPTVHSSLAVVLKWEGSVAVCSSLILCNT